MTDHFRLNYNIPFVIIINSYHHYSWLSTVVISTYLDFNLVEGLAVIDTDYGTNHFRYNDHVAKVSLHSFWLLVGQSLLLGLAKLFNERHGLALKTTVEATASTAWEQFHQLLIVEVKQLLKLNTTILELAEDTLLLQFSGSSVVGLIIFKKKTI